MSENKLFVGYDLCDDQTQIAVYNFMTFEPDSEGIMETAIVMEQSGEKITGFVSRVANGEPVIVDGKEADPVNLFSYYFRKTLAVTKEKYPESGIRKLVVTVEEQKREFTDILYQALETIGLKKDRVMIIGHKQSYLYYALCQKKELWQSDVGMFDYNRKGLFYYQMNIDRMRKPILVGVVEKDYTHLLHVKDGNRAILFENIAQGAMHRQAISTVYMTGTGFAGDWADGVMQRLCVGRRVFKGRNLYVNGACYAARELSGEGKLEDFLFLDEDMINSHITTKVYVDACVKEIIFAKAGMPWYQVDREIDVIPDGDEEIAISVKNILKRETKQFIISLDPVIGRNNKRVRIGIKIQFSDVKTCILTIRDKGFGDIAPSSHRIWEKVITLDD